DRVPADDDAQGDGADGARAGSHPHPATAGRPSRRTRLRECTVKHRPGTQGLRFQASPSRVRPRTAAMTGAEYRALEQVPGMPAPAGQLLDAPLPAARCPVPTGPGQSGVVQ
ncbi:MAG: hypothetical protein LBV60_26815, partial [Streptomyces sp.]|nr:hypothetical protein [Streptomyces sp.]